MSIPKTAMLLILALTLLPACTPPDDPGISEPEAGPDREWEIVHRMDLPPTASDLIFNPDGELAAFYQPAAEMVASVLDMEGRLTRLPGIGGDGPAVWHGDLLLFVSRESHLEADPGKTVLVIVDPEAGAYVHARGPLTVGAPLLAPAVRGKEEIQILVMVPGGIAAYSPALDDWALVMAMDLSAVGLAAFSPSAKLAAVVRPSGLGFSLEVADLAAGNLTTLLEAGTVHLLAWSPDSSRLATVADVGGARVLLVLDVSGEVLVSVDLEEASERSLSWVPGRDIVSLCRVTHRRPGPTLAFLDVDRRTWLERTIAAGSHSWTPDGRLAVVQDEVLYIYAPEW